MAENAFLRARVKQLEGALREAMISLDTAASWKQRSDEFEVDDIWPWLRSRAAVARRALESSPATSKDPET